MKPRITPIVMPRNSGSAAEFNTLDDTRRKLLKEAAKNIMNALWWDGMAEGVAFWGSVHDRLIAIAEGEPLK